MDLDPLVGCRLHPNRVALGFRLLARSLVTDGKTAVFEFSRRVIRDAGIAGRFEKLFSMVTTDNQGNAPIRWEERFLLLLEAVMRAQNGFDREPLVPEAVLNARSLIDDDPAAPITLSDLAGESGLSRFQVLRGFVRATGLTPHA